MFTDIEHRKLQKRLSQRISDNLVATEVSSNPFTFPGYFENQPGTYIEHKPVYESGLRQFYRVTPYDFQVVDANDCIFLVTGRHHASLKESQVHRRFFQFTLFRDTLTQKYPGLFIPPLPGKLTKQQASAAGHSQRVELIYLLNRFLQSVAS